LIYFNVSFQYERETHIDKSSINMAEFDEYIVSILGPSQTPKGHQRGWYGYTFIQNVDEMEES